MSLRCGCDLVAVERIEQLLQKHGRSAIRWLDEAEYALSQGAAPSLAAYFALKEAVAKALGTGLQAVGRPRFSDIKIGKDAWGCPQVQLQGAAAQRAQDLGVESVSVSLSHEGQYALAFCVLSLRSAGAES